MDFSWHSWPHIKRRAIAILSDAKLRRYATVGIISNLLLMLAFWIQIRSGLLNPVMASITSYFIGLAITYAGNHIWSFRSDRPHREAIPLFLAAYGAGAVFHAGNMYALTVILAVPPVIAQAISVVVVAAFLFFTLNMIVFTTRAR